MMLSGLGLTKAAYLFLLLPHLVVWLRKRFTARGARAAERVSQEAPRKVDRLVAILSLLIDLVAWVIIVVAGRLEHLPLYALGLFVYPLSAANLPSITSLATGMLPRHYEQTQLVGTLTCLANMVGTIGPVLNNQLYKWALEIEVPEAVFLVAAMISLTALILVGSVQPGGPRS
ncbi:hypothetical protein IE53DRAFT_212270 [Violaceomyces palustris]|uniref:Uncharacterized protein n=1 Tax=Violaceomyces palustris TaxID=1673888 RepID=A0ACD0NQL5_9BASI|nr:hypothetical protein IE53DRAFT_212270 [Violaceomyces palustris]